MWFYWYEISVIGKSIQTEITLVVAESKLGVEGNGEWPAL
jgi:hypothetical protein